MKTTTVQAPTNSNREYTLLAAWEQFQFGYDIFTAGQDVTVCKSTQQRRGWWAAYAAKDDTKVNRGNYQHE